MAGIIGSLGSKVIGTQYLINQGGTGSRTLALGGWTWTANPAASSHLSGNTNPLESFSAPSSLAIPANGQDWGYNTNKYGYDTGGVSLIVSPTRGRSDIKHIADTGTMSIQFVATAGGGTGTAHLYLEFGGRALYNAVGSSHNYTLDLTPAQAGWLLAGGTQLKYRMYAMNNENILNTLQVNILGANGLLVTHVSGF